MNEVCKVCMGTGKEKVKKILGTGEEVDTVVTCEACQGSGVKRIFLEDKANDCVDWIKGNRWSIFRKMRK